MSDYDPDAYSYNNITNWRYSPAFTPKVKIFQAVFTIVLCSTSFLTCSIAIWCTWRNRGLSRSVKVYIICDLFCRLQLAFFLGTFATCLASSNWYCIQTQGIPWSYFDFNNYFSSLTIALQKATVFFQLAMAANRFFAVFFDSQYYETVGRFLPLQVSIFFLIPLILLGAQHTSVTFKKKSSTGMPRYTFGGPLFDPRMGAFNQFYIRNHEWRTQVRASIDVASASLDVNILIIDLALVWQIHRQQIARQLNNGVERRLLKQIIANHVIYFMAQTTQWGFAFCLDKPILGYTIPTLLMPFWNAIYAVIVIYFIRPRKETGNKTIEVSKTASNFTTTTSLHRSLSSHK